MTKMAPGMPDRDRLAALVREVRDSTTQIRAFLSAEGLDDLPGNGPLVLAAIASGVASTAGMAAILGITEPAVDTAISALVQHGYLCYQNAQAGHGQRRLMLADRARKAIGVTRAALRRARWANFPFRRGDIVICSPPKTGSTWVQAICAFLIFGSPELPASMSELSAWLDDPDTLRDDVYAHFAAQEHRRILKAHLSLSDIPIDARATYIAVGRHPLDAALSMYHQMIQIGRSGLAPPRDELFQMFDTGSSQLSGFFDLMLRDLSAAWTRRDHQNLMLIHYEDLYTDLEGEMRRIAARLGIAVPEATWPDLVKAATFEQMRATADRFVPAELNLKDRVAFFRNGVCGDGRALFTDAELARYRVRAAQLAAPDVLAWLHRE
jgi:aryl sulfotransferase